LVKGPAIGDAGQRIDGVKPLQLGRLLPIAPMQFDQLHTEPAVAAQEHDQYQACRHEPIGIRVASGSVWTQFHLRRNWYGVCFDEPMQSSLQLREKSINV
jgi:hypothetical protein